MVPTSSTVLVVLATALAASTIFLLSFTGPGSGSSSSTTTNTDAVLIEMSLSGWIVPGSGRAICIGGGSAATSRHLGFRAATADACCTLPYMTSSFDFALAPALDRARVPARVVLEMERVLRPGRVGVVVRQGSGRPAGLMRAVAPVSSLLRFSDVVGARAVNGSVMVVFRKRGFGSASSRTADKSGWFDKVTTMALLVDEITEFLQFVLMKTIGVGPES